MATILQSKAGVVDSYCDSIVSSKPMVFELFVVVITRSTLVEF